MTKKLTRDGGVGSSAILVMERGISAPAAKVAHLHLLETAGQMNLRAEPHTSAITAVKLYDGENRYLFSWIINAHHLLFYIRKPALKMLPSLAARAQSQLSGVKINPAGEVTIRLETVDDAEALTRWLYDPATWSAHLRTDEFQGSLPSGGARKLLQH